MTKRRVASDFTAELLKDPVFVARREATLRAQQERREKSRIEQIPLTTALENVGVHIETVWDLVNTNQSYLAAIPTLVAALRENYSYKVREGIVRSLTTTEARGQAGETLLQVLRETPLEQEEFRWLLANALTRAATHDLSDALQEAASAEKDSMVRKRLLDALAGLPRSSRKRTSESVNQS